MDALSTMFAGPDTQQLSTFRYQLVQPNCQWVVLKVNIEGAPKIVIGYEVNEMKYVLFSYVTIWLL